MSRFAKMIGAGLGAAIAKPVVYGIKLAFPDMDQATLDALEYIIFMVLSGGGAYVAPKNA